MKKDMENLKKSNFQKPLIHWICSTFVNLIASLHMLDHKPNAHTQKAAQKN